MVIKFHSTKTEPPTLIYMGRDKDENEHLIRWGWPEDVWFHVDKLSSAHVYLRLQPGQTIESITTELLEDCAQLVKANSIEGCKLNNVEIVYTMWDNLKKSGDMAVGQVGFKSQKAVKKMRIEKKNNEILNRLNKTKIVDDKIDYRVERDRRDARERQKERELQKAIKEKEKAEKDAVDREKAAYSYDNVFANAEMTTNHDDGNESDDFM